MKKGFSLVELAVVMVIIGLIAGAVIIGRSVIASARNTKIISKLNQYETAVHEFFSIYQQMPGDVPNAPSLFPGSNQYSDGWGDRRYGGYNGHTDVEGLYAFPDMESAGVIKEGLTYETLDPNNQAPIRIVGGRNAGSVPDGGAVIMGSIYRADEIGAQPDYLKYCPSHLQVYVPSDGPSTAVNNPYFTPEEARALDAKMDDGKAGTGKILGQRAWSAFSWDPALNRPCFYDSVDSNGELRQYEGRLNTLEYSKTEKRKACGIYYCVRPESL